MDIAKVPDESVFILFIGSLLHNVYYVISSADAAFKKTNDIKNN
ncbi:hypothetical protein CLOBOL_00227 [Enterocloster bolteae ATCC BAA-613]|uniref:Uncharacterized protein n=1 Tax=Enterocloster bolteae (strain ATCC BAA-613 / DSM 15670 / CCUG 46953 / JCM 12243 / WAL 16351) TaxID=411902 RepID=A8RGU3_ENTBW|nr:hypothetical protein CLOBOL_00227 [Enterocloster bolteae ATCC BAA-613]